MKKIIGIISIICCVLVVLAGCSSKKVEESSGGSNPTDQSLAKIIELRSFFDCASACSESALSFFLRFPHHVAMFQKCSSSSLSHTSASLCEDSVSILQRKLPFATGRNRLVN